MNVTIESKRVKKDQVTQCHRCQLYGHGQRNCHAAAVCVKCAGPHQTAECTKPRDVPAKCALCTGPHTASYKGCPKSPYSNMREAPAPSRRSVAPKQAPKRPETPKQQPQTQKVAPTPMETDAPRPSTSSVKPSYAAAMKNIAAKPVAKPVARKPKTPGKPKVPAAAPRPKLAPKKPETPKPGKPTKTAVPKKPVPNVPRTRSTGPRCKKWQPAVILAGDLNAKHPSWNSRRTNASGTSLRRFADDLHLLVDATAEPTIYPHNGQPDVLDIVVMKDVAQFHQLTVLNELSSDHNPVLLQLGQAAPEDEESRMRQTVSWPAFANHLSAHIGPITEIGGPIELEAAVRQVMERVSDSVRYATNTTRAVDDRAFIPREVRNLIREKNRLRRQWQRTLNPARQTKVALDEFRNNRWGDFMERASESPSEFWRAVKALKGQRVPVPPIHGARGVAFTTEDKPEAFAETLERQCSPVYEKVDVDRGLGASIAKYEISSRQRKTTKNRYDPRHRKR
ncbi:hypothetical protein Trydic_g15340 [Trypoxylus dichotomus]